MTSAKATAARAARVNEYFILTFDLCIESGNLQNRIEMVSHTVSALKKYDERDGARAMDYLFILMVSPP